MKVFLDGDRICIVDSDFINLQVSNVLFVKPGEFYEFMQNGDGDEASDKLHDGHLIGECFVCKDGL